MDPNAAWKKVCEHLRELNRNPENKEAREKAAAYLMILYRWLRQGGFPPKIEEK
jgi:hypothetical protein